MVDLHGRRLELMDQHGIEMMILSLNAPAVQAHSSIRAGERTRAARQRFSCRGSAQAPRPVSGDRGAADAGRRLATREMERCVKDLGFRGALVNGFSHRRTIPTRCCFTTCRSTGRSGPWSSGSTFHSTCIRAIR